MSLPIDEIVQILRDGGHITDSKALQAAAKDLIAAEKELKETKETAPKTKTRLVVLARGDAAMQAALSGGAWVVSVPDDDSTSTYSSASLLSRLRTAAAQHNDAPKARRGKGRVKVVTWSDLFRNLKAKTLKTSGSNVGIKAKGTPSEVVVLTSENVATP